MRFHVLGPLQVDGGSVTATRDRVVLAMLLLNAGRIDPAADLVDALSDAAPPATARGQVQSCISRLRRAGLDIASDPAGYAVNAPDLDLHDFQQLTDQARTAPPDEARARLRTALDLWRGPALAGMESRAVRRCGCGWVSRSSRSLCCAPPRCRRLLSDAPTATSRSSTISAWPTACSPITRQPSSCTVPRCAP